jgi:phosphoribosylanthranilate isomerase
MKPWIKICGMTTAAAVTTACEAGVDAIGFVFARSVRQQTPDSARALARHASRQVMRVAVTLHPTQAEVEQILAGFAPDALQTDIEDLAALSLPAALTVLPVLRAGRTIPDSLPRRFLFEGQRSGAGEITDWSQAAGLARRGQLVLAGGLAPDNVAAAIAAVRPWGVDVSSGVESGPGIKDAVKIAEFVAAVRQTDG